LAKLVFAPQSLAQPPVPDKRFHRAFANGQAACGKGEPLAERSQNRVFTDQDARLRS